MILVSQPLYVSEVTFRLGVSLKYFRLVDQTLLLTAVYFSYQKLHLLLIRVIHLLKLLQLFIQLDILVLEDLYLVSIYLGRITGEYCNLHCHNKP